MKALKQNANKALCQFFQAILIGNKGVLPTFLLYLSKQLANS